MRKTQWGRSRGHSIVACVFVVKSVEEEEWSVRNGSCVSRSRSPAALRPDCRRPCTSSPLDRWTTSISEYAASRGSSGSKLLGGSLAVSGALQVIEGSLLSQLCVAPYSAAALLWAGGIACIVLGQVEASDECHDTPEMAGMKKTYAVVHAVSALAFVALTTAGVIIVSAAVDWVSAALAIGGVVLFLVAVGFQNLTGAFRKNSVCNGAVFQQMSHASFSSQATTWARRTSARCRSGRATGGRAPAAGRARTPSSRRRATVLRCRASSFSPSSRARASLSSPRHTFRFSRRKGGSFAQTRRAFARFE